MITVALAYGSTILAGSASYLVANNLFPHFMSASALEQIAATADKSLPSYFSMQITPLLDTLSAVVLAFILGLCLSTMKGKEIGTTLYDVIKDFSEIIDKVLHSVIIPLLPLYICGTFVDMTYSGKNLCYSEHFMESIFGGYCDAFCLHLTPVHHSRFCQQEKSIFLDQKSDSGLYYCFRYSVFCSNHSGKPEMCGGRRYL